MPKSVRVTGSTITAAYEPSSFAAALRMAARIATRRAAGVGSTSPAISRAKKCSTVCTTISPSLSERTAWPSLVSHAFSSSQFVTLPLCAP